MEVPLHVLALAATRNPTGNGRFEVSLTLPAAGPATLELLDVLGRRLEMLDVAALGAGVHTIDISSKHWVPGGLYVVRLTRGSESISRKIAFVP